MSEQTQSQFDPYHVWLGIPSDEQPPNAYRLLGIPLFEASADVITSAADRQMAHLRTFQTGKHSSHSQKLLNDVAAAKLRLLKPALKAAYDDQLKKRLTVTLPTGPAANVTKLQRGCSLSSGNIKARQTTLRAEPLPMRTGNTEVITLDAAPRGKAQPKANMARSGRALATAASGDALSWIGEIQSSPSRVRSSSGRPVRLGRFVALSISLVTTVLFCILLHRSYDPAIVQEQAAVAQYSKSSKGLPAAAEDGKLTMPDPSDKAPTGSISDSQSVNVGSSSEPQNHSAVDFSGIIQISSRSGDSATPFDQQPANPPAVAGPNQTSSSSSDDRIGGIDRSDFTQSAEPSATNAGKHPIPETSAQEAMQRQVIATYDPAKAKAPRDKLKLASQFLAAAAKSREATEQFVLLNQAARLGSEAGDAALAIESIDMQCSQFDLDIIEATETFLIDFSKNATSSERIRSLVAVSSGAIDRALDAQRYDSALNVAESTARACQRSLGKDFRKEVIARRDSIRVVCQQREELRQARATLSVNGDDEAANLVVARWACYVNGDWEQGLPYLAKIADAPLKTLAEQELTSVPSTPEDQMALGDAWWDLAKRRKGPERDALVLHAGHWYERSLMGAVLGLTRLKVEKRLEELAEIRHRQKPEQVSRASSSTSSNGTHARLKSD